MATAVSSLIAAVIVWKSGVSARIAASMAGPTRAHRRTARAGPCIAATASAPVASSAASMATRSRAVTRPERRCATAVDFRATTASCCDTVAASSITSDSTRGVIRPFSTSPERNVSSV